MHNRILTSIFVIGMVAILIAVVLLNTPIRHWDGYCSRDLAITVVNSKTGDPVANAKVSHFTERCKRWKSEMEPNEFSELSQYKELMADICSSSYTDQHGHCTVHGSGFPGGGYSYAIGKKWFFIVSGDILIEHENNKPYRAPLSEILEKDSYTVRHCKPIIVRIELP